MPITERANHVALKRPEYRCDRVLDPGIPHPIPRQSGFAWVITGRPGSGKSTLAFSTLLGTGAKRCYNKVFRNIFMVCPQASLDSMRDNPFSEHPRDKIFEELDPEAMDAIEEMAMETREEEGEFSLLIIDDCSADLKDKHIQRAFKRLMLNRRHKNLSIIILSQNLNLIPLPIRKAFTHITFFKFANKLEYRNIFDEMLQIDRARAEELVGHSFREPHDHITVDIVNNRFYRNFNELVWDGPAF